MIDPDRNNCVNIHHHLRDDVVVLLPYVAYRNGATGFGDGLILPRVDGTSIGEAILRMLDICATADTRPLEEKRDAAMERLRLGFDLSYAEQCPSFGIADNWGRIYEQYPAIVSNPWVSSRFFADATISDRNDTKMLTLDYLQLRRKDHGIYSTAHTVTIDRTLGPDAIGCTVSDRLHSWRPKPSFLSRLIA